MLIVLSIFFLLVWLVFFKLHWLPWNGIWKTIVGTLTVTIALVVVGALQHYTPVSKKAVIQGAAQQIYPLVSGRVETIHSAGAHDVAKGDKLFTIDPRPYQYAVDQWTATLKLADLELSDAKKLVGTGAVARIARDQKQAQYDQARSQLDTAQYQLENTTVYAPADGYVTLNTLRPGQRVDPGSVAMTFIDNSDLFIVAIIKQNGLPGIAPGKTATVTFTAAPGQIFQSKVQGSLAGLIQGQVTVESSTSPFQAINDAQNLYPILVALPPDTPSELRQPGALAQVTVFTDEGNPINILAKLLQFVSTWMDFVA